MTLPEDRAEWPDQRASAGVDNAIGTIEHASDLVLHLDQTGRISKLHANQGFLPNTALDHWVGQSFLSVLTVESQNKFSERLREVQGGVDQQARPIELNHADVGNGEFPIRYTLSTSQNGGMILMGRDMQPIAEVQQRLVQEQLARERDQQNLRREQTFYRVVLEAADTPMLLVDPEQGRIRDLNSAAADLVGAPVDGLEGSVLAQCFEGWRRVELSEALHVQASTDGVAGLEVRGRHNGAALRLKAGYFRAAGALYLLCRLEPAATDRSTGDRRAGQLAELFAATSDAILLLDAQGHIEDANDAFLTLADAPKLTDVVGLSLGSFLMRGSIDLRVVLDAASSEGQLRSYSSYFKSLVGTRVVVDISAVGLSKAGAAPGFGVILREVATRNVSDPQAAVSDDAMRNVMDLVGTASLKDLVSATSDVIEKICIETAIDLTNNNRAAAAEMLGLSRQSFYVKLRKHGLLNSLGKG